MGVTDVSANNVRNISDFVDTILLLVGEVDAADRFKSQTNTVVGA